MKIGLLAALVLFAFSAASAAAATTFKVNTTADENLATTTSGPCENDTSGCTLRAAVELADKAGEATVEVPAGTYNETVGPEYDIAVTDDSDVTIVGAGTGKTIVENEEKADVFEVDEAGSLTLDGVTVQHGREDAGGGIFVSFEGTLIVENSAVTNNVANDVGGGIFGEDASSVAILNSSVASNQAGFSGGGVDMEAENEDECELARGDTRVHHDAEGLLEGFGSGLTVVQSTIEGNTAEAGDGGGILIEPACRPEEVTPKTASSTGLRPDLEVPFGEPSLTIEQSTIDRNSALAGEGGGIGGGIYEETPIEDPIIDTTIVGNFATDTGGGVALGEGFASLVSDTVEGNSVEPEVFEEEEEPEPGALPGWTGLHRTKSEARAVHPDDGTIVEEPGPGANLAADPDALAAILLRDTIVAEPQGSKLENCGEGEVGSLIEGSGYNLDDPSTPTESDVDTCGMSEAEHDLVGVNPELNSAGLQKNGGPTETIALLSNSPAIGFVPFKENCEEEEVGPALSNGNDESIPVDQRGVVRPGIPGKGCDVGAYEYQEPPAVAKEATKKTEESKKEEPKKEEPAKQAVLSVKITSPLQCASKRAFTIHIQNVKQFGIVSATVSIDGKHKRTLTGSRLKTAINLRGLPKGTFTVEIVAHTRSGQTLHGKRVYHTCHLPLPGQSRLRL
jgi:CSLREA domain-containing protein